MPLVGQLAANLNKADGPDPMGPTDWSVVLYCLGSPRTLREAISRCTEAIGFRMGWMSPDNRSDSAIFRLDSMRVNRSLAGCVIDLHGLITFHAILGWLIGDRLSVDTIAMDHDPALFDAMAMPNWPVPAQFAAGLDRVCLSRSLSRLAGGMGQ